MADVFTVTGRILLEYSDAVRGLHSVDDAAEDATHALREVDEQAEETGDEVKQTGDNAKKASDGFTVWKGVLSNLVSNALQAVIQKCAELGSKLVDLTKTAVSDYANYEQLVGGIETLYGDSADTMISYAENAYKTAGLSANEYMDTATSFAASLVSSLGGDTSQAAELANQAITDMSDNANKMGTDMESIQNAYQGFAKGNFDMLDNLKLGYGGTQSEMIRLVNESGILEEAVTSIDEITFDQMIEAIHAVQDKMGITGTTAAEAGTTISGSWASVQALFENILTKVGGQLAPTIMSFLNDLAAWLETVDWNAFAETIGNSLSEILDYVSQIDFGSLFESALNGITAFVTVLGKVLTFVPSIVNLFTTWFPLITGIAAAFATLKAEMAIAAVIKTITGAWKAYKTANEGATVAQWLFNAAVEANPLMIIVSIIAAVVAALVTLYLTNDEFREKVQAVWSKVQEIISAVVEVLKAVFSALVEHVQTRWNQITEVVTTVVTAVSTAFQTFMNVVTTVWNTITNIITVAVMVVQSIIQAGVQLILLPWQFLWENFGAQLTAAWEGFKSVIQTALTAISTVITTVWDGIKTAVTFVVNLIVTAVTNYFTALKTALETIFNAIKTVFVTVWNAISTVGYAIITPIVNFIRNAWDGIRSFLTTVMAAIKNVFVSVWGAIRNSVSNIVNGIKTAITGPITAAKGTVSGVLDSIKSAFSDKLNGALSVVRSVIDKIKNVFNFSWSLPSLKLPHVSITGKFSINPPSVPSFGISWYKKAMDGGMVLDSPTIFGYNPNSGNFLAGGEAGSEAVVGTNSLMSMIQTAVDNSGADNVTSDQMQSLAAWLIGGGFKDLLVDVLTKYVVIEYNDRELGRLVKKYA